MRVRLIQWSAACAMILSSTGAVASVLVVKSFGPSAKAYPPGKILPDGARITLKGGDVVTLLGRTRAQTIRGPGTFDAKQVTLASAVAQRGRFGAVRAARVARNPSIWDIDASMSGNVCVTKASQVQLWRPDSDAPITVKIRAADGKSQDVSWAAGKALAAWPGALPIVNGAQYRVEWPDGGDASILHLVEVSPPPADLMDAAQFLIENGCESQLDLLIDSASEQSES